VTFPNRKHPTGRATWAANATIRRLQRIGLGPGPSVESAILSPSRVRLAGEVLDWVRTYVGEPHPELGRSGPICPFVQAALNQDVLSVAFDEADGTSRIRVRGSLLAHSRRLVRSIAHDGTERNLKAFVLVFPRLHEDRFELLDEIQDEVKIDLMTKDLMVASHHPRSTRPAIWNPEFHVMRAPFAAFAVRPMDIRDVVFVGQNARVFARYRERYGRLYSEGLVSDQFGNASAYAEALRRFGDT
jgi:hypothetical protein